jgi:hypothetical protein
MATADLSKIDLIIQYALLTAGEEDGIIDRRLGRIHLIKYVYLADLEYAKSNNGETYTGTQWRFYHFGPWSEKVHERVEVAANYIHATKHSFPADYGDRDEWFRWEIRDSHRLAEIKNKIPAKITLALSGFIHKHTMNTQSLLVFVYQTQPMLHASPHEDLDFMRAVIHPEKTTDEQSNLRINNLSNKKQKKLYERIKDLRGKTVSVSFNKTGLVNPVKNPRYDDVYLSGINWLDEQAGNPFPEGMIVANFSPDVWKASPRTGDEDVPR